MEHTLKADTFGKCIACDRDTITRCDKCGVSTINEYYKERKFKLSDKSVMKVAFCTECAEKVKEEDFDWIMENVILGWEETLEKGNHTPEQKKKIQTRHKKLKILDFA